MPVQSTWIVKLLTASACALAVIAAPAAHAEGGIPDPGPSGPQPVASQPGGGGGCQSGESLDPSTGNCTPTMTSIATTNGDQAFDDIQPRTTQDITTTSDTGIGADLVPNINGDSCTGYWQSTVCYEEDQDNVPVQPKSTISSSP
ncbi:hypothetical protein FHT40_001345 [Mycolicibacterium sp. BK556]|uniref:hypothetical protein n=1 Tax=Mycobacteriaceae TaxID=1762 RepID=UPI00105E7A5D|nr:MULTISPECIES: hypothetical protein [Mycobacteriaceae]MBB3601712.1 hypothetical protein [Mycolicibacterium sp. BK556]MBB3631464.1 hypothetical protein [Mycolicibacterium sp. BK607]MBB3749468.1 hypothetical protein [Mycolicibacterium sp. BK634]TDO14313.1 hypothetical protein EV580_2440 [Mycobacterium sp. BK086]